MRAVAIKNGKGPISALYIDSSTPVPVPHESQALIKIRAFGLNRMDLLQREGQYPVPPQAPATMGVEFSGTIVALPRVPKSAPEGCRPEPGFKVGDEVFGLAYGGAYAEYIAVSTHMLLHKPKELSWEEAAGIPETWITATQAMYLIGAYKPGETILWHAGASSVSIAGIQLAKADGAGAIYVTASSREKIEFCKGLGATEGFSYKEGNWAEGLLKATGGKGVDVVIDFVGASYFDQNLDAVAKDGRIVNLGFLGGNKLPGGIDIGRFLIKRVRYEGSGLRSRDEAYQGRLRDMLEEHALPRFVDGRFKVVVERVFKMEEIQQAHELMASSQTKGKIICTVD